MPAKDYNLDPARLDQLRAAHRDAEGDLDALLAEPQIRQSLAEDDPAIALSRIAAALRQEYSHEDEPRVLGEALDGAPVVGYRVAAHRREDDRPGQEQARGERGAAATGRNRARRRIHRKHRPGRTLVMEPVFVTAGLTTAALAITGLYLLARPTPKPADLEPTVETVAELGDWDAASLAEVAADPDPLDISQPLLTGEELVPAYTFADVHGLYPVALDFPAISFTQEWVAAGERLAQLGDTQQMQAIPA
jgi:hypothetical protein